MLVLHRENRFRMKLDPFDRESAMTHAHDHVSPGGSDLEDLRDTIAYERMIAANGQRRG